MEGSQGVLGALGYVHAPVTRGDISDAERWLAQPSVGRQGAY
jgi:hypothetical protein